ncbi:ABC transporter ATP-binding protein [Sutcliffiella rhizosphaerae]|uniref:HMP/thiamine import ATP-binding protein YkoD n=1 Tax=Sutcliffiella rhizosphaerae TaxID=2880967 RepID=A0ABN8ABL1_9BACI|nr:ABC transporter ATP-binding protein [Sutcliffiella rhizosphaerae]CAG9622590.1 Putative HMP/thiamine import ATP-binding protein YkoD [Sutcliffiella rhizosphaerae]
MVQTIVEVEEMNLKYSGGTQLFHNLSLSVQQGEKVLIIGPSGCGKSTLIQVLSGLIPDVLEVPMIAKSHLSSKSWGYVFQDPETQFCMPFVDEELAFVLENLAVPKVEMEERIVELLELVGLQSLAPHTKISQLSGGMKQRLAIASVLAMDPEVLFLDEPTALLDPDGTMDVWDTIKKVGEDKTVIIVEHKVNQLLDFVGRIIVMDNSGQIVADGPTTTIFQNSISLLKDYGVWYPDAWHDYLQSKNPLDYSLDNNETVMNMEEFIGYRGNQQKIYVPKANIRKGEWITIVGENGAGKSTLLEAMMKLLKTEGKLFLEGSSVKNVPTTHITYVFQNPEYQFITKSVEEEIGYTIMKQNVSDFKVRKRVEELLLLFNLERVRHQHPYQLSTGQKRRLSVAAAVVDRPKILLLDEPTYGQDSKNTFAMLEWLEQLKIAGVAIIMVTHDQQIVSEFADTVWTIKEGTLVDRKTNEKSNSRSKHHAMGAI